MLVNYWSDLHMKTGNGNKLLVSESIGYDFLKMQKKLYLISYKL